MSAIQNISVWLSLITVVLMVTDMAESAPVSLQDLSLPELEQRLNDIDTELEDLAQITLRNGTGSVGYRSKAYASAENREWFHIDLGEEVTVDQVVLVPTLFRDPEAGIRAEGFPQAFKVYVGNDNSRKVVASRDLKDELLPRLAPLAVTFAPVKTSWVRIEASHLSPRISDHKYMLQLAEIMVFSGLENVALRKPVRVPESRTHRFPLQQLTDGFTPFRMDATHGARSQTKLMDVTKNSSMPTLTIDLQEPREINEVILHSADITHSIPMETFSNWGVPRHIRVTGSMNAEFDSEALLFEDIQRSILDSGPIIMRRFEKTMCRYVRITIVDHRPVILLKGRQQGIAFSEIEVMANGHNVALRMPVKASQNLTASDEILDQLTDGLNYYGAILPVREWMNQLSRRHDLEKERPQVVAELNSRYSNQKKTMQVLAWTVAALAAGTVIAILVGRQRREQAIAHTRKRIAANLHDELGANLHAIALFGDLAKQEADKAGDDQQWSKLKRYVEEVRILTDHAGKTARYTTNMLEAKELYENLTAEMQRVAEHLLTDLEHEEEFENEEMLQLLSPRRRAGLFLFYHESLINIIRHSGATRVKTHLKADKKEIHLAIRDNGCGFNSAPGKMAPESLKRRARLLKANLSVNGSSENGTLVTLRIKPRKWNFWNQ
ncbi:hypothetical protein NT6N_09360 [Oceaniferula spumae]|uniref:ATP-binding protein n=1 Tax=Oceaniferula spumae TaxID=2979115 RepID=A0AAT9FIW0_9BACT